MIRKNMTSPKEYELVSQRDDDIDMELDDKKIVEQSGSSFTKPNLNRQFIPNTDTVEPFTLGSDEDSRRGILTINGREGLTPMHFAVILMFIIMWALFSKDNTSTSIHGKEIQRVDLFYANVTERCNENEMQRYFISSSIDSDSSEAACIDNTTPAFYMKNGTGKGKNKWHVHFEGGGWCYDARQCFLRSKTPLGSSKSYPPCGAKKTMLREYLSESQQDNPVSYNWNTIYVRYCDGGSYAGNNIGWFRDGKVSSRRLFYKGYYNRIATINTLLYRLGMDSASTVSMESIIYF